MDCIALYKCLCDETRLRILNLLKDGPLCVCHVQDALQLPQPKISKQLSYMKRNRLLVSRRRNNWTIYELPRERNPLLEENLRCLQDLVFSEPIYQHDRQRLRSVDTAAACPPAATCCERPQSDADSKV